jgi:ABC-type nickel/cobalt efflux system permease component RcnA
MRRLGIVICSLLVLLAGAVSAWASCKEVRLAVSNYQAGAKHKHQHEHHGHSDHNHSHNTGIHCLTLNTFLPAATFSSNTYSRTEPILDAFVVAVSLYLTERVYRSIHGPPGFIIPGFHSHLSLSVLRI